MTWTCARAGLLAILLASCATTNGPDTVLTAKGPIEDLTRVKTGNAYLFLKAANDSFGMPADGPAAQHMLDTGFDYIEATCSDFFATAGQTQKWLIVARDTVGAVGTLATAGLALADKGTNAVAAIGLGTSVAFSGIDIYTKNFLFSADNIESVRTLTMKALNVHREAVEKLGPFTYTTATVALLDNQNICSPMQIAALSRDAIKNGTVIPSTNPADDLKAADLARDQIVLRDIGRRLKLSGAVTVDQAGALWWLLKSSSTDGEKQKFIATTLADLPSDTSPFKAGKYQTDWALADQVSNTMDYFSDTTKASFEATIAATKKSESNGTFVARALVAGISFSPPSTASAPTSAHVSVSVK